MAEGKKLFARLVDILAGSSRETEKAAEGLEKTLVSPVSGKVLPLASLKDEAFSSGALGPGVAIVPRDGVLKSPCDGTVDCIPEAKHAVNLIADNGAEVLIHIGMDTVELKGAPFTVRVEDGQKVKAGDTLIEFDIEAIKAAGLETVTPVVVANPEEFAAVVPTAAPEVEAGDPLLTLKKKS